MGNEEQYYAVLPEQEYHLSLQDYPRSSVPHPMSGRSEHRTRSPSRFSQLNQQGEVYFVNRPAVSSTPQSYPIPAECFVDEFLVGQGPVESAQAGFPAIGGTPEFGDIHPAPPANRPIVRECSSHRGGDNKLCFFFKVLESFVVPEVSLDAAEIVSQALSSKFPTDSVMWSGMLTNSKLDRNYKVCLILLEKGLTSVIDATHRKLLEVTGNQAQHLVVFLRRIWTGILPVCGGRVEKWIREYNEKNCDGFYKDVVDFSSSSGLQEWDAEDEAREKTLDDLDARIADLEAEIEQWENFQRDYAKLDHKATLFLQLKRVFRDRLLAIESVPVESTKLFLEGGSSIPSLPAWEHPQIREKKRLQNLLQAEYQQSLFLKSSVDEVVSLGAPPNGSCFEPGIRSDSRWNRLLETTLTGWNTEPIYGENFETNLPSPVDGGNPTSSRRLSLDALKAFAA